MLEPPCPPMKGQVSGQWAESTDHKTNLLNKQQMWKAKTKQNKRVVPTLQGERKGLPNFYQSTL